MKSALNGLAITLFVSIASSTTTGCLIDRGDLPPVARRDASVDAADDAPEPDTGSTCGFEQTMCPDGCANLAFDPMHCGTCSRVCAPGQACTAGRCEGCAGVMVHGICADGLRVWLDARDPNGDGTPGMGPLSRWANLAHTGAGDAVARLGAPAVEDGAGGRRVVRLEGARLETMGDVSDAAAEHVEIFLVARARTLAPGVTLEIVGDPDSPLHLRLPGVMGHEIALPEASAIVAPFGRDVRHTTLWHALGGPTGRELRVDGTLVQRGDAGLACHLDGALSLGADAAGNAQAIDVSELLVFDRPLSSGDRAALTAALVERWGLGSPAMPVAEGMSLWLDARTPLAGESPTDGAPLPRWDDRSPRAAVATTVAATYLADGLGAGHAAVVLGREGGSNVSFPRPVSDDLTALVVLATEDGGRSDEGWASAHVLGSDGRYTIDDAALVLANGRPGLARTPSATLLAKPRIDDGRPHVLVLRRRASDGLVELWIDHEPMLADASARGGVTSPATWFLGRGSEPGEGGLDARYGEVLVYARLLDDEELTTAERYLVRRWETAPAGSQPLLDPCERGRQMQCPVRALSELRSVPAGSYWIDLGAGPHRVSIDDAEGGGWALVLQYVHGAGQNPERDVVQPGEDWPLLSPTALGGADAPRSTRWGHVARSVAASLPGATELRFYGATSEHGRVLHFRTSAGLEGWRAGTNTFAGLPASFTALAGHTGVLPGGATTYLPLANGDDVLTEFPFHGATGSWAIRGTGTRWEMDDLPFGPRAATIHRVWVR